MGVKGLWRLLLPIGRRISIETLHGKVLAIDASIWLTQFLKAMRDPVTGKSCVAAHLIGFFRRLCRLRFHGIKPVFVFDGATPEIKKREVAERRRRRDQFAVLTDGSVQRLARKLLQETLQKIQKEAAAKLSAPERKPSGFVAGFNPGGEVERPESDGQTVFPAPAETDGVTEKVPEIVDLSSPPASHSIKQDDVNDWDLPLAVVAVEEAKEMEIEESETQYEEFNVFSKKKRNRGHKDKGDFSFSVQHVASLPAVQRKDAVEQAKRNQRMQSRNEFMPAAANPATFSNVQLKNFLKSCQLNKDIHAMAKTAAIKDNEGLPGEATASDRTTRVELIREFAGPSYTREAKLLKSSLQSNKRARKDITESSDDEDWGESSTQHDRNKPPKDARRVIDDDEGSSEFITRYTKGNDDDMAETSIGAGFRPAPFGRNLHGTILDVDTSDDDSQDCRGGFLPTQGGELDAKPSSVTHNSEKINASSDIPIDDEDFARKLQEREDFKFARELQSDDGGKEHCVTSVASKSGHTTENRNFTRMASPGTPKSADTDASLLEIDDESSADDNVDWEDGEAVSSDETDIYLTEGAGEIPSCRDSSNIDNPWVSKRIENNDLDLEHEKDDETQKLSAGKTDLTGNGTKTTLSPETSAVLLQAQATAANLTDWAGRAFIRAIKEAGGEYELDLEDPIDLKAATRVHAPTDVVAQVSRVSFDRKSETHGSSKSGRLDFRRESDGERVRGEVFDVATLELNDAQWTAERNRRERDMDTISDEMLEEAKQLLQLFGVPYVDAPTEAEAQCAELEELGLVDGIVTEDSDVFVFGGKVVYKNIFDEQKYAEAYAASDAEREMKLGRNQMVALAMLLGGDYTEGVKGVGIVNAMEILEAFDVSDDLKKGLSNFRKWLDGFDPADALGVKASEHKWKRNVFHAKHWTARTRWIVPVNFPADNVMKAYLDPVVDKSKERFSWGVPDVESLITFCNKYIGWPPEDTKALLDPVMKGLQGGLHQTRIDSYMKYEDSIKFAHIRSKRLRDVLGAKTDSRNAP